MMGSKGSILAAYGMMAALSSQEQKEFHELTNKYDGLPELKYSVGDNRAYKKEPLTNKQKKSRAKSKMQRQSRKRNKR